MYEFKKIGKVFTSKFVGTGPMSYKKIYNLPGRGLTKVKKHWLKQCQNLVTMHGLYTEKCMIKSFRREVDEYCALLVY